MTIHAASFLYLDPQTLVCSGFSKQVLQLRLSQGNRMAVTQHGADFHKKMTTCFFMQLVKLLQKTGHTVCFLHALNTILVYIHKTSQSPLLP